MLHSYLFKNFAFFFMDRYNICFLPGFWKNSFLKRVYENKFSWTRDGLTIDFWPLIDWPPIILIDRLSQTWDLFGFKFLAIRVISSLFMVTFSINLFAVILNGVNQLQFIIRVHSAAKNLFKKFCFFWNFVNISLN